MPSALPYPQGSTTWLTFYARATRRSIQAPAHPISDVKIMPNASKKYQTMILTTIEAPNAIRICSPLASSSGVGSSGLQQFLRCCFSSCFIAFPVAHAGW